MPVELAEQLHLGGQRSPEQRSGGLERRRVEPNEPDHLVHLQREPARAGAHHHEPRPPALVPRAQQRGEVHHRDRCAADDGEAPDELRRPRDSLDRLRPQGLDHIGGRKRAAPAARPHQQHHPEVVRTLHVCPPPSDQPLWAEA